MKIKHKLTSVKIIDDVYLNFKQDIINTDMTLQKLVNRTIDLYLSDISFRKKINDHNINGIKNLKF